MKKLVPAFLTTALLGLGLASGLGCDGGAGEGEGEGNAGEGEGAAGEGEGAAVGEGEGEGGEGEGAAAFDYTNVDDEKTLINGLITNVLSDTAINGYFSNGGLDAEGRPLRP